MKLIESGYLSHADNQNKAQDMCLFFLDTLRHILTFASENTVDFVHRSGTFAQMTKYRDPKRGVMTTDWLVSLDNEEITLCPSFERAAESCINELVHRVLITKEEGR
jgi:hypothetical protein